MFWMEKTLKQLNEAEWESLCDGCGRCCVQKFEDEDSGEVLYTDVRCELFDDDTCRCTDYDNRQTRVPDCINIRKLPESAYHWLPERCAYRLRFEGKPLFDWHPLITGDPESVHEAGVSLRHATVSAEGMSEEEIIDRIFDPSDDD